MTSLANLVAARVELLDLNLRSGMCADDPRFLRLAETSVDSILAQIRNLALIPSATIVEVMKQLVGTNLLNEELQNRIRDAMIEKVNHNAPTHNAANCKYQSVREPHKWLPDGLHNMVWLPGGQQDPVYEKLVELARFFGSGGLLHGTEPAYRDIAALAMLHQEPGNIISRGQGWLREFKKLSKAVADSKSRSLGVPRHELETPDALKRDCPEWYKSMYSVGVVEEGGASKAAQFEEPLRLMQVREYLGCRGTKHRGKHQRVVKSLEDSRENRSLRRMPSSTFLDDGTRLDFLSGGDTVPRTELPALPPPQQLPALPPPQQLPGLPPPPPAQGVLVTHPATTALTTFPPPAPQQPTLAALPAPKPTDLSAHIARMAEVMKGGTSLAEKSEAMKELQSVATEIGKGSPSHKATKAKQKEPSNKNRPQLLTPTAAGKKKKQKVSPPTKPKTLKPQKKRKTVAPKGSPSVLEFPPLNFPGTGKKPNSSTGIRLYISHQVVIG